MNSDRILREIKYGFPKEEIKKIVLYQIMDESEYEELRSWKYDRYINNLPELANDIFNTAQSITDELGKKMKFMIAGLDSDGNRCQVRIIRQKPEKEDEDVLEPNTDGQILQSMKHAEAAYRMVVDILQKQAVMMKDLMESYHKRMLSLEKREDKLAELVRGFQDYHADTEERMRREDRFDRFFELIAGYLTPAAAKKLMDAGLITTETAASISAAGKDMQDELTEEKKREPN